ncbi:MAG: hypothetical protein VCD00_02975 [Candidatus Hydrogenedentota bacterium]
MNEIRIDVSRALAQKHGMPRDDHYGSWTFIIDGTPVTLFGSYAEAKSLAKLYVRMYDVGSEPITLTRFATSGHLHLAS